MTSSGRKIRVGLMGFGHIGRQLYHLAAQRDDIDIVAIADIGRPDVLHYLLCSELPESVDYRLEGNFLINPRFAARMLPTDLPTEVPWDMLNVDMVVDSTRRFNTRRDMLAHLGNGAGRVLLSTPPVDDIDRMLVPGLNQERAQASDRLISAGSATIAALGLLLKILDARFGIEVASMVSVHAYTNDQALQDTARQDFRRSRSAAENIIPNSAEAPRWVEHLLPRLRGKLTGYALNVPVQRGSLLDTDIVFSESDVTAEAVNDAMIAATQSYPGIVDVTHDPIVSSDVIGNAHSLLFDLVATLKAGSCTVKTLCWYDTHGHASRLLDVIGVYRDLDRQEAGR